MESIRVIWAGEREAHLAVPRGRAVACYEALVAAGFDGITESTPGSMTVQVRLPDDADPAETVELARSIVKQCADAGADHPRRVVEIPICSDPDLAPDLNSIAHNAGLSIDAAAELHASCTYSVRFLGFSPGFPYLDGLPEPLHAPRLESPRARVRAGSVGIAGDRTGIYPQATPGGWRLVGATPLRLFGPNRDPPALLAPGDRVRFRRIDRAAFDAFDPEMC